MEDWNLKLYPVKTERASQVIFNAIKDRIASGEISPGNHLPSEQELMEQFQRSRPTIREALRMLEASGYTKTISGNKGAIVLEPTVEQAAESFGNFIEYKKVSPHDILDYREIHDVALVGLAAQRRTNEDLLQMETALCAMKDAREDFHAFVAQAKSFLDSMTRASHNEIILMVSQMVRQNMPEVVDRVLHKIRSNQKNDDGQRKIVEQLISLYTDLFEAIKQQDAALAQAIQKAHLGKCRDRDYIMFLENKGSVI